VTQLARADQQYDILKALRGLKGDATVGDVVAATGLATHEAEAGLKALLESHRGHLAVTDSGELLYQFDPRLIQRGTEPLLARLKRTGWALFTQAFKAWIVVMLVVYFVVFVVLVIAALVASQRGGGDRKVGDIFGGRRGGGGGLPNFWLWYWIWGPRWRLGRPYYGHRWERTLEKDDKVPFYKKVFAFVFGPDRPSPTQKQLDRGSLRLIRARRGVVSTAELVEHTGLPAPEAEEEMARLVGTYGGEPVISPRGELAYAFPPLMVSAHGRVTAREPNPAWMRLEFPVELTGNTAGANALVAGMNGFNLLAAVTAPWFIFPRLGMGGTAAFVFLVVVPVIFSLSFFAVPGLRMLSVARENRRRKKRNVRRVVLGQVYRDALGDGKGVTAEGLHKDAAARLSHQTVSLAGVRRALQDLAAEFDAEVAPDDEGRLVYRFPAIRREVEASELMRRSLRLEEQATGDVVFSTADTALEAGERELAAFDRALEDGDVDLTAYVPSADRVGFEADYEVVAFEDELRGRGVARA
jgi:hypothetical protein